MLTSSTTDYYLSDQSLLNDLPKTLQIIRTPLWDMLPVYEWLYKLRLNTLAHYVKKRERYFMVPDRRAGWIHHAYRAGLKAITSQKIDVLFTTSEPYSGHLIGLLLKLRTGAPWVADFRDEWADDPEVQKTCVHTLLHKRLERFVLRHADVVVSTSKQLTEMLSNKLPDFPGKFLTITNGYDEEDILPIRKKPQQTNKFTILYTGTEAGLMKIGYFFGAIRRLLDEHRLLREEIEIRFVGVPPSSRFIEETRLHDVVTTYGYVEHGESVRHLADASVLLLTTVRGKHIIPGKTFEYLATGKPILALVYPDGVAADLIRKAHAGVVVPPDNTEEISDSIEHYYQDWKRLGRVCTDPDWSVIEQFDRRRIAEQFAEIFVKIFSREN